MKNDITILTQNQSEGKQKEQKESVCKKIEGNNYTFSYSPNFENKNTQNGDEDFKIFYRTELGIEGIKEIIKKGWAIAPALFERGKRSKKNVIHAELLMVDIDNKSKVLTIEKALENDFVKQYGFIYTTPSHSEQLDKYRIIFFLEKPVETKDYELLQQFIDQKLGGDITDKSARDSSRIFFGNTNAQFFNDDVNELPTEILDEAEEYKTGVLDIVKKKTTSSPNNNNHSNTKDEEIIKALNCIDSDIEYQEWLNIGFALHHHYQGSDRGFDIYDEWSSGGSKYDGRDKLYCKWQTFNNDIEYGVTIKTLFKIARAYGYKPKGKAFAVKSNSSKSSTGESGRKEFWQMLQNEYKGRLRFNELLRKVELDGKPGRDLDLLYVYAYDKHEISIAKEIAYDTLVYFAKNDSFHPVRDYLNKVFETGTLIDIEHLSSQWFKTDDPIYDRMLYITLIGAVARIYNPGCKFDTALVLKGKQGILKSSCFEALFGEDFFTDALDGFNKDDLMVMHSHWCCELAELDSITSKKEAGELKAFLARKVDCFRLPYGRIVESMPRASICVGSVNKDFLVDETGNRRFITIPVKFDPKIGERIDLDLVAQMRDNIWHTAVKHYRAGAKHFLTFDEQRKSEELNDDYTKSDAWDNSDLDAWLMNREFFTIKFLLVNFFGFELKDVTKSHEARISKILTKKGYTRKRKTINGVRDYYWGQI